MGTSGGGCSIVWFRRDLRVEDNPALAAGVRAGAVVAVFIWAPEEEGHYYPGRVSRWWLKQSLSHLDISLKSLGTSLVTKRSTDSVSSLLEVIKLTGAKQLFFNHLYDPISLVRDHRAKELLTAAGIAVRSFNADLLYEPWEVNDQEGRPFTTFAGFWERCLSMPYDPEAPLLPPKRIISADTKLLKGVIEPLSGNEVCDVSRCMSDTLVFEDESEKGSNALLARAWSPGWSSADKALTVFLNGPLIEYSKNRRKADSATTSFLSPHLHFGEVSVRKVFHLVRIKQVLWANEGNKAGEESVNLFLKSIGLREYSRYMSFNHPYSHERPLLGHLKYFPWVVDEGYFKAWRQGRTGYPLVDAGMRELWATGWLHDRIRVVVSSFFVKVLQLPWRWGMKYFWDTLLDADLESDALGWQYISGTLPDGREFDRIDNPQSKSTLQKPVCKKRFRRCGSTKRLQEPPSRTGWKRDSETLRIYPIAFPPDTQMEMDNEPIRNNTIIRRYEDQMVPSMTVLYPGEDEEASIDLRISGDSDRAEVPSNINLTVEPRREPHGDAIMLTERIDTAFPQSDFSRARRNSEDSTAESSSTSSRRERDGGLVPVWSPSSSAYSDQFPAEDNGIGTSSSYLQRHPQSHQLLNWRRLSQTGGWSLRKRAGLDKVGVKPSREKGYQCRRVRILRNGAVSGAPFQRVRAGSRVLRGLVHDPTGPERVVPGPVREAGRGGELGGEGGGGGGAELRRVRGVQHGGAVRGGVGGEGGDLLRRGVLGGEGFEGGAVSGGGRGGRRRDFAAADGGEDEGACGVHLREAAQGIAVLFAGGFH
ncbi:hypothetical protein DH2020_035639 [Rehmannia glutinosa]|uniref:Photolyase/cryptochrome alpha/beta domain-containing protein n=1 Tax=Rehmannia glutinosa TaxID=99300 RepID=A0ABR0V9A4_REHGL